MTDLWTWTLILSLILLAISATLKAASMAVTVKRLNDDIAAFRKQIETINQKFDEATQKQGEIHAREKDELMKTIFELNQKVQALESNWTPNIL